MAKWPFEEPADSSGLSDADWAHLNKLKAAYESGGSKALSKAIGELATDPIRYVRVVGALFPEMINEKIRDALAEHGITEEDLREMLRKAESPSSEQH